MKDGLPRGAGQEIMKKEVGKGCGSRSGVEMPGSAKFQSWFGISPSSGAAGAPGGNEAPGLCDQRRPRIRSVQTHSLCSKSH